MFITGSFIQHILLPRRMATIVAVCCSLCILLLFRVASNIGFRLSDEGTSPDFPVFTFAMFPIVTCLAISLHCIDACCDCLLQECKARAQTARKLTSVAGSLVSISLLLLPHNFFLLPVLFFACCTVLLGIFVCFAWWFMPASIERTFLEMKKRSTSSFLTAPHIAVAIFAALISDNADQVLDAVANIQIDSLITGGSVKYAMSIRTLPFSDTMMQGSNCKRDHEHNFVFNNSILLSCSVRRCKIFRQICIKDMSVVVSSAVFSIIHHLCIRVGCL